MLNGVVGKFSFMVFLVRSTVGSLLKSAVKSLNRELTCSVSFPQAIVATIPFDRPEGVSASIK